MPFQAVTVCRVRSAGHRPGLVRPGPAGQVAADLHPVRMTRRPSRLERWGRRRGVGHRGWPTTRSGDSGDRSFAPAPVPRGRCVPGRPGFRVGLAAAAVDRRGPGRPRPGGASGRAAVRSRAVAAGAGPSGPDRAARAAGPDAGAGTRPDPVRPDARVAVHVLPGRGRRSWPPTWRARPSPASRCSCAGTPTCRTSVCSAPRSAGCCSTSTTSTRRCPGRGSGTSSGSRPASRSWAATAGSPLPTGARSSWPASASTGTGCAAPPGWAGCRPGTSTWRPASC